MLSTEDLIELEDAVKEFLDEHLTEVLVRLNRTGELGLFLKLMQQEALLHKEIGYQVYSTGKVIVIGQSEVKPEVFYAVAKKIGLPKERLELYLNYKDAKTINFKRLQWQPQYAAIMVGPMPHSGEGKGEHGSIIAALEVTEGYPPVVRLGSNELKITKSNFRNKLQEMKENGVIV